MLRGVNYLHHIRRESSMKFDDFVKLEIMSDGTVVLDGSRITLGKMWGIQTVVSSHIVKKSYIIEALGLDMKNGE